VPEGPLRQLIEHSLGLPEGDDLALLNAVGRDCPGAIELRLSGNTPPLIDTEGMNDEHPSEDLMQANGGVFRFSLAGVQMKFSVLNESEKVTIPAHNRFGEWIVKLDSNRFRHIVENEFATMSWARAAGFSVPDFQLLSPDSLPPSVRVHAPGESNAFIIRRYDRVDGKRIHQEDFAQVFGLPPEKKYALRTYEVCAFVVHRTVGHEAYLDFVRRLVFMIASGNTDAHLKNWSFYYPDSVNAQLAPLYDQVAVVAWPEIPIELALGFAGTKDPADVDDARFRRLARLAQADEGETLHVVRETVEQIAQAWNQCVAPDVMPDDHIARLRQYWEQVPLFATHMSA
jgi:serine/threonine-protein kinase HipA